MEDYSVLCNAVNGVKISKDKKSAWILLKDGGKFSAPKNETSIKACEIDSDSESDSDSDSEDELFRYSVELEKANFDFFMRV
jgi:hypothetical protein